MNEQTTTPTPEQVEEASLNNQFDNAMRILLEAQRTVNIAGVEPAPLASALCASYVTFVAALCAASGLPKEQVTITCKEAIDTMGNFVAVSYDRMVKEIEEASK
jgi:hypothetical protein